jgi:hypothetical protein
MLDTFTHSLFSCMRRVLNIRHLEENSYPNYVLYKACKNVVISSSAQVYFLFSDLCVSIQCLDTFTHSLLSCVRRVVIIVWRFVGRGGGGGGRGGGMGGMGRGGGMGMGMGMGK